MIDLTKGVPNLDKQTIENLDQFHEDTQTNPSKIHTWLFPDYPVSETKYAIGRLGDYANARMRRLIAVALKDTVKADVHKEQAARVFSTLPPFAKWK